MDIRVKKRNINTVSELTNENLIGLFQGDDLVLQVKNYFERETCLILKQKILKSMKLGFYENAPNIGRVGKAFYETINNPYSEKEYFENQAKWIEDLRKTCSPFISPIDALRLALDDIWSSGSIVASIDGQKMFVGLVRYFTSLASAEPHQDIIQRDAPHKDISGMIKCQLAFNVYLEMPEIGGELEIWDWVVTDEEFKCLKDQREGFSYALNRERIRKSNILLKPDIGDLILFNSNNVHAVTPSSGERLSISCFIGYCGMEKPLVVWS